MLAQPQVTRSKAESAERSSSASGISRGQRLIAVFVFAGAVGLVLAYALPGGAYDIVIRQEYGIVLWCALGLGIAFGLLPRSRPSGLLLALLGALAAYGAWTALSLGWTDSSERTAAELARVLDYIGLVALIGLVLDRRIWRAAVAGLGAGALLVCALAVASRFAPGAFPANALAQAGVTDRLSYPFGYWNAVGAWAAMSCAIALAWSAHDRSPVRRALALGPAPIAVVAVYLSYSRAGAAGMAVGVIAVLILSSHRLTAFLHAAAAAVGAAIAVAAVRGAPEIARGTGTRGIGVVLSAIGVAVVLSAGMAILTAVGGVDDRRLGRRLGQLLPAALAVVLVGAAIAVGPHLARRAWNQFRHPAVATTADPASRLTQLSGTRYEVWRSSLRAFAAHPVSGTGAGTFEFWWDAHATDSEFVRNAHSFELESLAELGVVGLALIMAVMGGAIVILAAARRRSRRSLSVGASAGVLAAFIVYLVQATVDWLWQSTAVTVLALAGVAAAAARLSTDANRLRWWWRAGAVALAAAAVLAQIPGLVSTVEIRRSQAAERAHDPALALAWAKHAVGAEPWAASPYEQRGLVLEAGGRLAEAAADLQRAATREPDNFRHWLILSRIQTERGLFARAEADYVHAHRLRPRALVFSYARYFRR